MHRRCFARGCAAEENSVLPHSRRRLTHEKQHTNAHLVGVGQGSLVVVCGGGGVLVAVFDVGQHERKQLIISLVGSDCMFELLMYNSIRVFVASFDSRNRKDW
jgi:hypothetical protein